MMERQWANETLLMMSDALVFLSLVTRPFKISFLAGSLIFDAPPVVRKVWAWSLVGVGIGSPGFFLLVTRTL